MFHQVFFQSYQDFTLPVTVSVTTTSTTVAAITTTEPTTTITEATTTEAETTTEPATTEQATTESTTTEPAATEPVTTKQAATESAIAEPATTDMMTTTQLDTTKANVITAQILNGKGTTEASNSAMLLGILNKVKSKIFCLIACQKEQNCKIATFSRKLNHCYLYQDTNVNSTIDHYMSTKTFKLGNIKLGIWNRMY